MFTHHPESMRTSAAPQTRRTAIACAVACFALGAASPALATLVDTGDVQDIDGSLSIGSTAYGKREATDETAAYAGIHLGVAAGITGELFLTNSQYTSSGELAVGVAGTGLLNVVRDTTVQASLLTIGKNAGSTGSVVAGPSVIELGTTGKAVIGDAGTGTLAMDGYQYSESMFGVRLNANQLILGAQVGGNGSLNPSCESTITLSGTSPTLLVGDYGSGTLNLGGSGAPPGYCPTTLDFHPTTPGTSQIFVARKPGSHGTLTLWGDYYFKNVDVLRIGMDDLGQPGGTGSFTVQAQQSYPASASIGLTEIGPQGTLHLASSPDHYMVSAVPANLTSDVHNLGTFVGSADATLTGNFENAGNLLGASLGICYFSEETTTVIGNFTQTSAGQHTVNITAGPCGTPTVQGSLAVQGMAQYDGTLNVVFTNGSQLVAGDQFAALSVPAGTATYGPAFAVNFDTAGLPAHLDAVADVLPTGIVVRIVPKAGDYADLALSISDTPDPALAGQDVTYTISVQNNGTSPATGVTVSGTLPACSLGDIAVGATASCTRTVTATTAGVLTQTVSVSGNETDPDTANNSATAYTSVYAAADLGISISAPASATQGDTVDYTIVVTNYGPGSAWNVTAAGTLPTCSLGAIAAGASATCTRSVTAAAAGTLTHSMSVSGSPGDTNAGNDSASVSTTVNAVLAADLALAMTATPDPVKKNAKLVYTLTVTNTGPDTATDVSLTDTLPANIRFVSAVANQGTCSGTSTVNCALGSLASGGQITVTITLKPTRLGTLTNTAQVTAAENDPDASDNSASTTTSVVRK